MPPRETKRAELPLSRASPAGVVEGYASLFGVGDSGGDIVMAGAFARSIAKRGPKGVKMLWQHDAAQPIGVWTSLVEDAKGLKVAGRLDLSVARAREALSLVSSGAVDGLSIGFRTKRATTDMASGLRRLQEVDLWEISIVTFPMLPQARIDAVKRTTRPLHEIQLLRLKAKEAALRFQRKLDQCGAHTPF
ncbi:HK97 family phage prohead protease [Methylocystis parvus]|uniref:HK97 family phage prohead protease n=1 Tax=Methylocystis parvus TaxID=134 RepID=UPI003C72232D